jgi:acyl-CoA oxidase
METYKPSVPFTVPPRARQGTMMKEAREAGSFHVHELTCLIYGGYDLLICEETTSPLSMYSANKAQQRRDAFERVETLLGTRDTFKLPSCYANQNREEMYEEGLKAGRVMFQDGLKHEHDFFLESTSRGVLGNARYDPIPDRDVVTDCLQARLA